MQVLKPKNPLEESLSKLDLQATLVMLNILSAKSLDLYLAKAKKDNITKLMQPATAIKLPLEASIRLPKES